MNDLKEVIVKKAIFVYPKCLNAIEVNRIFGLYGTIVYIRSYSNSIRIYYKQDRSVNIAISKTNGIIIRKNKLLVEQANDYIPISRKMTDKQRPYLIRKIMDSYRNFGTSKMTKEHFITLIEYYKIREISRITKYTLDYIKQCSSLAYGGKSLPINSWGWRTARQSKRRRIINIPVQTNDECEKPKALVGEQRKIVKKDKGSKKKDDENDMLYLINLGLPCCI